VRAEFVECARECLDVGVREMAGEVLLDPVSVVAPSLVDHGASSVGEDDENRAAVVVGADTTNKTRFFQPVDDASEAALAREDPLS